MEKSYKVLVVGGGAAGITVAANLKRKDRKMKIGLIEPSEHHYYQPAWTLVGAGAYNLADTHRDESTLIPKGVDWIQNAASSFDPENNSVKTVNGDEFTYDYLVVAAGIQLNWDGLTGLKDTIGKNGVTTNYHQEYAPYTWELLQGFSGGNALFTQAATTIKCGGAPQKITYLAEDYWRKNGIREKTNVIFASPGTTIFAAEPYATTLRNLVEKRNIDTHFFLKLDEIRAEQKEAVYSSTTEEEIQINKREEDLGFRRENGQVVIPYEMMHLAPPQSAPDFIQNSPLANEEGWVDVHKYTMQHNRYSNIFSLGDASSTPNAKTGAAVRKQAPVVVNNIMTLINSEKDLLNNPKYNGYSSCPIITAYGRMLLAEFDYDNNAMPTFPFIDTSKELWIMWLMKKYMLPWVYWERMLKGKPCFVKCF